MSCLTRQSFVKSVGLGAGVASLAPSCERTGNRRGFNRSCASDSFE